MIKAPRQKNLVKKSSIKTGSNESVWWKENEKAAQRSKAIPLKSDDKPLEAPPLSAVLPKRSVTNPSEDKAFVNILSGISSAKQKNKKHPVTASKVKEAQSSVKIDSSIEKGSIAKSAQVIKMSEQKKGKFNAEAFKLKLLDSVKNATPKDEDQAKDFKKTNKLDESKKELSNSVASEKDNAGGSIESAAEEIPDTSKVQVSTASPLINEQPGLKSTIPSNGLAAPKPKSVDEVGMDSEANKLDDQMTQNGVTQAQLENSNEPSFLKASSDKKSAQKSARNAPADFKKFEDPLLKKEKKDSDNLISSGLNSMFSARSGGFKNVDANKNKHKLHEEEIRTKVAQDLQKIYDNSKGRVTKILSDLDRNVNAYFDAAINSANLTFTNNVEKKLDEYYGLGNIVNRVVNSLKGLPAEVDKIFAVEKKKFETKMTAAIDVIASLVESQLNRATDEITYGKNETERYWKSQSADVKKAAGDIYTKMNDQYSELEKQVSEKEDSLVKGLSEKYTAAVSSLNDTFNKLKEEKKGWLEGAFDAINGAIKAIKEMKDMLLSVLAKVANVVGAIIADPIGFLGNLIDAVSSGIKNFGKNFLTHLKKGFFEWLMGAMPPGIEFPTVWDMKGIFTFVMSVLGLTWTNIRARTVKKLGEPVVSALETMFDIFEAIRKDGIAGLWNYIKEKIDDLKTSIVDSIMDMLSTEIIKAGIAWILSLMNPASAFIKACKLIYDLIMWFVNNAKRILELINSIVDSTALIVKGDLKKASEKVEESMARIIPITIGFLAGLLGLGNLSVKVQEIINKIQVPVNKAIDWVIDKAVAIAYKLGIPQMIAKGKQFVDKKVEQGKAWAKDKAGKLLSLLGLKKTFKGKDGETHSIFFEGDDESAVLMVASNKKEYGEFLDKLVIDNKDAKKDEKEAAKTKAGTIFAEIISLMRTSYKKQQIPEEKEVAKEELVARKYDKVNDQLSPLSEQTMILFDIKGKGNLELKFGPLTPYGFATLMEVKNLSKATLPPTGSVPGVTNNAYDKLKKRPNGNSTFYILGHLLNHNLGGSGKDYRNLTPLSRVGNKNHLTQVESMAKEHVDKGNTINYRVAPVYITRTNPENLFPEEEVQKVEKKTPVMLDCELTVFDPDNKEILHITPKPENPINDKQQ